MQRCGKPQILALARAARDAGNEDQVGQCNAAIGWADALDRYAAEFAARSSRSYQEAVTSMAEREEVVAYDVDCDVRAARAWCQCAMALPESA